MKKISMRILAAVICLVMLLGDGSLAYATSDLADSSENVSETVSEEDSEEASEESTDEISGEASEEATEEVSEEVSEKTTEEVSEDLSEDSSEANAEETGEETSEETSEADVEGAAEEVGEETSSEPDSESAEEKMFPGVTASYVFREETKEERVILQNNINRTLGGVEGRDYAANQILVAAVNETEAETFAAAFGGTLTNYVVGVAVIELNAKGGKEVTVEQAVKASADPANCLPAAWPNTIHYTLENNDPALNPSNENYQWQQDATDAEYAWDKGYTGKGIKVVVLDTGVRRNHEDIKVELAHVTSDDKDRDKWGSVYNNTDDDSYVGHGTHVCGIIGATAGNGKGGAGIAPDVSLYSCNVFMGGDTAYMEDVLEGLQWAIDQNADVVNLSMGSVYYNYFYDEMITEVYEEGIAVFCAAGNDSNNGVQYPAGYEHAISIAALDVGMQKSYFSTYGDKVRYAFPGVDIYSTAAGVDLNGDQYLDELHTDKYCKMSGTSMATPVASGVAAVTLQYAKENGLLKGYSGSAKVDRLLEIMDSNCIPLKDDGLGKGMVSLSKLVGVATMDMTPNKPEIVSNPGGTYSSRMVYVEIAKQKNMQLCYTLDGSNPVYKNGDVNAKTYINSQYGEENVEIFVGDKDKITLKLMAVNTQTGLCSKVVTQKYVLKPEVTSIKIKNLSGKDRLTPGESTTLSVDCFPANAYNKAVKWVVADEETDITVNSKGVVKVKKNAKPGEYYVVAMTKSGPQVGASYRILVEQPTKNISAITSDKKSYTIFLNEDKMISAINIVTKDGSKVGLNELNWKVSDSEIVHVYPESDRLCIYGNRPGKVTLTGTATDGSKKKITLTITVADYNIFIRGSQYGVLKGTSSTYNVCSMDNKKMSSSLYHWSVEPAGKGVTVNNGKVKVSKDTSLEYFTLKAVNKELEENMASITIAVCDTKVKSVSVDKEYRNITLTRNNGEQTGTNRIEIPYRIKGGDELDVMVESANRLVSVSWDAKSINLSTGNKCGTDTIYVKSVAGNKTLCKIAVKVVNPVSNFNITFPEGRSPVLTYKKSMKLVPCFGTVYGTHSKPEKTLTWYSENPDVIKVDKNGKITAVDYEGTAVIVAESKLYGVRAEIKITATDVVKKIWIEDQEGNSVSTNSPSDFIYICADLQHREENMNDVNTYILPVDYFDAVDMVGDSDAMAFTYWVVPDDIQKKMFIVLQYEVNRPGKYKAVIKLRDGNKAKGKFVFDCK